MAEPEPNIYSSGEPQEQKDPLVYEESQALEKLSQQRSRGEQTKALFSDVDNTFYREGHDNAMKEVIENCSQRNIPMVCVTGNDYKRIKERIQSGELPNFDVIIGSVATEIWVLQEKDGEKLYKQDKVYEDMLKEQGFNRKELVENSLVAIKEVNQKEPEWSFNFQDPDKEEKWLEGETADIQPFKISFYFFGDNESVDFFSEYLKEKFPGKNIIICEEIHYNKNVKEGESKKYCADILPISKGGSIKYLSQALEVEQGIVAGDSGNDVDMLLENGNLNSVLVGGYKPEALSEIEKSIPYKKPGKRGFQKVINPDGTLKAVYVEPNSKKRKASESIIRAAKILERAENIKNIRKNKLSK